MQIAAPCPPRGRVLDGESVRFACVCVSPSAMELIPLTLEPIVEEPCDEELENGQEAIVERHNGNGQPLPALHIHLPRPDHRS